MSEELNAHFTECKDFDKKVWQIAMEEIQDEAELDAFFDEADAVNSANRCKFKVGYLMKCPALFYFRNTQLPSYNTIWGFHEPQSLLRQLFFILKWSTSQSADNISG